MAPEEFLEAIAARALPDRIEAIFHQGACADTTLTDGRYMMENNFRFSKQVLGLALERKIPLVYASSAAVYGGARAFAEQPENERPLNLYGLSKLAFDMHVRSRLAGLGTPDSTVAGLRYFNVYGPREAHKGKMASMLYQLYRQLKITGRARLFAGTDGFPDGEQRRDFVSVEDVVRVNLFFADGKPRCGIFNVGSGVSRSFNDVARTLIGLVGRGEIEYVPFPAALAGKYQSFTEAELTALRAAGCEHEFKALENGIADAFALWEREPAPT